MAEDGLGGALRSLAETSRVLSLDRDVDIAPERTGVFTSGMVWIYQGHRIALFFTGSKHAGENLADLLKQRPAGLPPPIQMCDALSRNVPKLPEPLQTPLANCIAHGRRNSVKVTPNFPGQFRFVLGTLEELYGYDAVARGQGMSPEERLHFHQEHSGPVMEKLLAWLHAQLDERKVEPNSGLGQAISYLLTQIRALREYAARRSWRIALQVKEVGSGASRRQLREKLLDSARRREIEVLSSVKVCAFVSRGPIGLGPSSGLLKRAHGLR
jgi:hypothetical protein